MATGRGGRTGHFETPLGCAREDLMCTSLVVATGEGSHMPKRSTPHKAGTKKYLQNCSFELLCAHWFVKAGWQVFTPLFDHGHQTDLLVSDGPHYFRIQVKTAESGSDDLELENKWSRSDVHYVALFAKNSSWGIVFPAFSEKKRKVSETGGIKFELKQASFMKAFHTLQ